MGASQNMGITRLTRQSLGVLRFLMVHVCSTACAVKKDYPSMAVRNFHCTGKQVNFQRPAVDTAEIKILGTEFVGERDVS